MIIDWAEWGPPLAVMGIGLIGSLLWYRRLDATSNHAEIVQRTGAQQDLDQGKTTVLAELRQLELDRDKLDPDDYKREREALIARGAGYLEQLEQAKPMSDDLTELVNRLQELQNEAGSEQFLTALKQLGLQQAPPSQMGAEWRGALFALSAVAIGGLMFFMAADESRLRVGDEPMTGTSASPPPAANTARARLEEKLATNPQDVNTLNQLTQLALGENDLGGAQQTNQRALAADPTDRDARMYRAVLTGLVGMHERSISYLDELIAEDPNFAAALSYKGIIAVEAGLPEIAIPALEKAIAIQGNHPALENALRRARGEGGREAPSSSPPAAGGSLVASGTIKLGENAGLAPEGATLFIAVRNPAGGPPLAALKRTAQFPQEFKVTTDDAIAMGGAPRPFPPQVKLVIRVDTDGNAMTREEGAPAIEQVIDLGQQDLVLELN
jgi:tetratricopeptide (TPR) repeat protein